MERIAFLIMGSEDRFRTRTHKLAEHLSSIGCKTTAIEYGTGRLKTAWLLWKTVRSVRRDQIFLLVYNGHGLLDGWEVGLSYRLLCLILRQLSGRLMVVNDTCYGYHLLPMLQKFRSAENTCFISAWDSHDLSHGGPMRDILEYWPQNMVVEDRIKGQIYSSADGEVEVPVQIRWGTQFDHFFFPGWSP